MKILRFAITLSALLFAIPAGTQSVDDRATGDEARYRELGARIKAHVTFLADDALEGREAGTRGHEIAARYIAAQFALAGAKGGGAGGGYLRPVQLHEVRKVDPEPVCTLTTPGGVRAFTYGKDVLVGGAFDSGTADGQAPLVFVGFGVEDATLGIDDYKGLDVRGKYVVTLLGPAKGIDSEVAAHLQTVAAKSAARHGAVGIIGIPTHALTRVFPWATMVAVYRNLPATSWIRKDGKPDGAELGLKPGAIVSQEAATSLFEGLPRPLADLLAEADTAGGRPKGFALPGTIRVAVSTTVRRFETPEVVAVIEGTDPALRGEDVALTAHADHIGLSASGDGDRINNGALDNAAGVATLIEVARALSAPGAGPRRSVLLIAHTAEEKGLLGAQALADNPPVPADRITASFNLDMPILLYDFTDVVAFGATHSTLDKAVAAAAATMHVALSPDPMPDEALFVRSDHYAMVRVGVPSVMLATGMANGGEAAYGTFLANHYHKPSDDLAMPIDWRASGRFAELNYRIIKAVADDAVRAGWYEGDYFGQTFAPSAPKSKKAPAL